MPLDVQRVSTHPDIPTDSDLRAWLEMALPGLSGSTRVTLRIVDRDESRELNRRFRQRDRATNVLSFPAVPPPVTGLPDEVAREIHASAGEIVVCAPLVAEEASAQDKAVADHWAHLLIHAGLHLLGHDHIEPDEAAAMEAIEIRLLARLGIANPYE